MVKQSVTARNKDALPLADPGIGSTYQPQSNENNWSSASMAVRILSLIFAMFLGGIIGLYFQPPGLKAFFHYSGLQPGGGTDTPIALAIQTVRENKTTSVVSQGDIFAMGRIIPRGDVVTLGLPFGAGDTRIEEMRVSVGDLVETGDVLAVLDNRQTLEAAVNSAEVNRAVQAAALAQTRATIAANLQEAQAELEKAEVTKTDTTQTLERTKELFERGVVSDSALQTAMARAEEANRDVERRRVTLSRYSGDLEKQVDVVLANANLLSAEAELAKAQNDVARSLISAPISGTVLDVNANVGERPNSSGILDLGNTETMVVEAEVYQSLIGRVTIGDPVSVLSEIFDSPLEGTITAIGIEIGRQSITSDDPAANTDARVVDVIVTLDENSSDKAKKLTNLQVVIRIDAGRSVE